MIWFTLDFFASSPRFPSLEWEYESKTSLDLCLVTCHMGSPKNWRPTGPVLCNKCFRMGIMVIGAIPIKADEKRMLKQILAGRVQEMKWSNQEQCSRGMYTAIAWWTLCTYTVHYTCAKEHISKRNFLWYSNSLMDFWDLIKNFLSTW